MPLAFTVDGAIEKAKHANKTSTEWFVLEISYPLDQFAMLFKNNMLSSGIDPHGVHGWRIYEDVEMDKNKTCCWIQVEC